MKTQTVGCAVACTLSIAVLTACDRTSDNRNTKPNATTPSTDRIDTQLQGNGPSDPVHRANAQIMPTFRAFCEYLNRSLDGTNRLDVTTAKSKITSAITPSDPKVSPSLIAALNREFANKPGVFSVRNVGGKERVFQFMDDGTILEPGNQAWQVWTSGAKQMFDVKKP